MNDPKVIGASVSPDERTLTIIYDESVGDRFTDGVTVIAGPVTLNALKRQILATVAFVTAIAAVLIELTMLVAGPVAAYWAVPVVAIVIVTAASFVAFRRA